MKKILNIIVSSIVSSIDDTKILFIIIILMLSAGTVQASEIFGQISTNPSNLLDNSSNTNQEQPANPLPPVDEVPNNSASSGSSGMIFSEIKDETLPVTESLEDIKVLGINYYPDNSLLRGRDHRIYIIQGQIKKYISSLNELQKYSGQAIYDVSDQDLAQYQKRQHLNGDLIREKGTEAVYVVNNNQIRHILNLEELRANFYGQEIFNIGSEEMRLYFVDKF